VRLHEKGGKEHEMPTHHNLDRYLEEYIAAAGICPGQKRAALSHQQRSWRRSGRPSPAAFNVWRIIRRRAAEAGIEIGCHTFRATGITAYLRNGGRLEVAQQMAAHKSAP
jgi:integrase/recombinase XerD